MNRKSLQLLVLATAACLTHLGAQAADETAPAPAAETPTTAAQQARIDGLKKQIPGKLSRKPKAQRLENATQWQNNWASGKAVDPFDQPQEALTHFLGKRVAAGQTTVGPENYQAALEHAAKMPVYSSQLQRLTAPASPDGKRAQAVSASGAALAGAWQPLGPGNVGGRTRAILIHPTTPETMWAAGVAGGIWKSTDGGNNWAPKADLLVNIAVNSMLLDPRNPNVLYAGTGEGFFNGDAVRGAGILKSTDGGETWTQLPSTTSSDFFYVQKIVMSRGSSQRLYAATRTGVFRSLDGGTSWSKVIDATAVNGCMDLAIQTDRALASVFASCGTFTQATIYRALDSATTPQAWNAVHTAVNMGRTTLAIAPSNQNIVYAMAAHQSTHALLAVYRSTTGGTSGSWTTRVDSSSPTLLNRVLLSNPVFAFLSSCGFGASASLTQGWYDNTLAVDPVNPDIVWAGGIDLFRSDDGGQNFGQASHWWFTEGVDPEYNHADQHTVVFHPQYNGSTNKVMFTGNDGGIHKTLDARAPVSFSPSPVTPASPVCGNTAAGTVAWQTKNNGYQITQFYHGAHYPDGATYIAGAQDNGTQRGSVAGGQLWTSINGGDGGYVAVNPNNTQQLWLETTNLSLKRSVDGGASSSAFTSGIGEGSGNFLFTAPFAQDPNDPNRMWIGGGAMWRTAQATATPTVGNIWQRASGPSFLNGARVSAIAVSPLSSDRVYAGTQAIGGNAAISGAVFTTGSGTTATIATVWTGSKPRPGVNYVSWITADPVSASTVYATISTFNDGVGQGHVFKSVNNGATWANIDGSGATAIPDVPTHTIVVDPLNNQHLYVGTDIGVFVSTDGGSNWARENTGFANVIVESLTLKSTSPRYLYAFTHGRSVFRAALPEAAAPAAAARTGEATR